MKPRLRLVALWSSAVALPWMGYYLFAFFDLARFVHHDSAMLELERGLLGGASAPEWLAPLMGIAPLNLLMVVTYVSFYVLLLGLPVCLLRGGPGPAFRHLRRLWAKSSVLGYPIYLVLPTQSPYYRLDLYNHPPFELSQRLAFKALDGGVAHRYDAFPSMHVALALVAVLCVTPILGRTVHRTAWVWLVLLHIATLATGSHYLLDLVAGDALGLAVWRLTPAEAPV